MPLKADKLVALNKTIMADILKEWRLQGHYLSGNTEKLSEHREFIEVGRIILEGYAPGHAEVLEEGVDAENIPYNSSVRTGAKTSQYIQALKNYSMQRFGLNEKDALGAAFAIAKKHEKEGMPSQGSNRFSSSGERRKAILTTFIQNEDKYFNQMDEAITDELDRELFQNAVEII